MQIYGSTIESTDELCDWIHNGRLNMATIHCKSHTLTIEKDSDNLSYHITVSKDTKGPHYELLLTRLTPNEAIKYIREFEQDPEKFISNQKI